MPHRISGNSGLHRRAFQLLVYAVLVLGSQSSPAFAEQPLPSEVRSSFWALSTALADYQEKNEQRFPSSLTDLKPYLAESWRGSALIGSTYYARDYAGQSFYDIPMETLKDVPVFIQTQLAADGQCYGFFFDARIVKLTSEEVERHTRRREGATSQRASIQRVSSYPEAPLFQGPGQSGKRVDCP